MILFLILNIKFTIIIHSHIMNQTRFSGDLNEIHLSIIEHQNKPIIIRIWLNYFVLMELQHKLEIFYIFIFHILKTIIIFNNIIMFCIKKIEMNISKK